MARYRYRYYGRRRSAPAGVWVAGGVAVLALTGAHAAAGAHPAAPAHATTAAAGISGSGPVPAPHHASSRAARAIAYARSKIGDPYVYGATGPDAFDCSGLVQAAWAAAGVSIPRVSEDQWAQLPHVSTPQPGDLILYTGSPVDPPPGHVTMYLGGGQMIEAYATGYPVRITGLRAGAWGYARPS